MFLLQYLYIPTLGLINLRQTGGVIVYFMPQVLIGSRLRVLVLYIIQIQIVVGGLYRVLCIHIIYHIYIENIIKSTLFKTSSDE